MSEERKSLSKEFRHENRVRDEGLASSPSLWTLSLTIVFLSLFLYTLTYNLSYQYHKEVVPSGDPFAYTVHLFQILDIGEKSYFSGIKSVLTSPSWYWLYKLPVAVLSPFLSKEPFSLCIVNYLFMALATISLCRLTLRLNLSFNCTLILSLTLWAYPWIYGLQSQLGLFTLALETSFYLILTALASSMIVFAF